MSSVMWCFLQWQKGTYTNSFEEPRFFLSSSSFSQFFYSEEGGKHHFFQAIGTYLHTIPHTNTFHKTAMPVLSAMKSSSLTQQSFNYTSVSFTALIISDDTVFCTPKLCCRQYQLDLCATGLLHVRHSYPAYWPKALHDCCEHTVHCGLGHVPLCQQCWHVICQFGADRTEWWFAGGSSKF